MPMSSITTRLVRMTRGLVTGWPRIWLIGATIGLLVAAVTACTEVSRNTADSTPPIVALDVSDIPGVSTPSAPILSVTSKVVTIPNIPPGAAIGVSAVTRDSDSGAELTRIRGEITTTCREVNPTDVEDPLAQDRIATILNQQPRMVDTSIATLPENRVAQMTVKFPFTSCLQGFEPVSQSGSLYAEGQNGAGGKAKSALFKFSFG
jgi:hypothetical protein